MMPEKMRMRLIISNASDGFTLVELIIAMIITSVLGLAVVTTYITQQRAADTIGQVSQMQQQLRGALYLMEQDIRLAGYDPEQKDLFGIVDVRRYTITDEITNPGLSADGSPSLALATDWDPVNPALSGNGVADDFKPTYRLFDENNDGVFELIRDDDTTRGSLLAEGMEAIGFAYAYDFDNADPDGELDRNAAGNIIWAVDTNNDNLLDTNLDANGDGILDLDDDTDTDFKITAADGAGLANPVQVKYIRMVQIWLLARARTASKDFNNNGQQFLVGDRVVPATAGGFNDNFRRQLLIRTVQCRNAGL